MTTPAIDYEALLSCLVQQISEVTGIPQTSVYGDQPVAAFMEQPAQPFFTIHFASSTRYGFDYGEDYDVLVGPRGIAVSFNCFAENHRDAMGLMETWSAALFSQVDQSLNALNFAVSSCEQIMDMSEKYSTGYQPRMYMQAIINATSYLQSPATQTGSITQAMVTGLGQASMATPPVAQSSSAGGASTFTMSPGNSGATAGVAVTAKNQALALADSGADATVPCVGFVIGLDGNGNAIVQTDGTLPVGTLANLVVGRVYFLGNDGQPTPAPVTDMRYVQALGIAVSDSQLALHISPVPTVRVV